MSITFSEAATEATQRAQAQKPRPLDYRDFPEEVKHKSPLIEPRYVRRIADGVRSTGRIFLDGGRWFTTHRYYDSKPLQPEVAPESVILVMDTHDEQHAARVISWEGDHVVYQWGALTRKARIWAALSGTEVDEPEQDLTGVAVAAGMQALKDKRVEWEERLGKMAQDEDWCGEFESVMKRAGLESRRRSLYTVEVRLHFEMSATSVDEYLASEFGGSHDTSESFDLYSDVTLEDVEKADVDNQDVSHALRRAGYGGWAGYDINDYTLQED